MTKQEEYELMVAPRHETIRKRTSHPQTQVLLDVIGIWSDNATYDDKVADLYHALMDTIEEVNKRTYATLNDDSLPF